ncbi:hypothetical protein HXX76_004662 [Chlamydomonas incerta]|uniref:Structural maintenance of chromosomes protein 6 n=1 Tax=Chlamydomonas incerta TaxID=51695 RepID=A0A835W6M8_CHLIN|nr:hypothetical protein HXX76_004662 [Chlamydomonas incerta]|eukprot:KAG2439303.1 hypothetical protein HXX76_004662 [Chlamydomonas incerta]
MRSRYKADRAGAVSWLAALKAALDKACERVQATVAAAEQVCSREEGEAALARARELADLPEEQLNPRDLMSRLALVNKAIEKVEQEAGADKEQLRIKLADLGRQLALKRVHHARVSKTTAMLAASMQRRQQLYLRMLGLVQQYVNAKFSMLQGRRRNLGFVRWDHEHRKLQLHVKIKGKDDPSQPYVHDLKQMSGGERSFTTVAFLLAVGANTENPFRVMDEYDVFMDAFNSRVATESLLECCRDQAEHQFIFLTPNDLATVEAARQALIARTKMDMPPSFIKTVLIRPARG